QAAAPQPPSLLDGLDPAAIPEVERFDGQPRELVAVLGEQRAGHWDVVRSVVYSPDGKWVASGGLDRTIVLADADTLRTRAVLRGHTGTVYGVAFAPDSRRPPSGSGGGTLRMGGVVAGRGRFRFQGPDHGTNRGCVSPP